MKHLEKLISNKRLKIVNGEIENEQLLLKVWQVIILYIPGANSDNLSN